VTDDGERRGRPGRPRTTDAERRDLAVRVRVSPGELASLHESARAAGLAVSSYLRGVGLRHRVRAARSALDLRLLGELNRLGNNFNQFLVLTYTHRAPDALAPTVESLRLLLETILAALSSESSREESP
jgi:hypothetical protein